MAFASPPNASSFNSSPASEFPDASALTSHTGLSRYSTSTTGLWNTNSWPTLHGCPYGIPTCPSCTQPADYTGKQVEAEETHLHSHLWHTTLALAQLERYQLDSPALYRGRMSDEIMATQQRKVPGLVHRRRVLGIMAAWQSSQNNVLATSVDAFLLLWLGLRSRDRSIVQQGHHRYQSAIRMLQTALDKPDAVTDDNVMGAVTTISACEMFQPVSQGHGRWTMHAQALYAIIRARGPRNVRSQLAKDIVVNFYHVGVMQALRDRRPFVFGDPAWLVFMRSLDNADEMGELRSLVAELPEALAETDNLLRSGDDEADGAIRLVTRLSKLDRRLQDWLLHWYQTMGASYKTSTVATAFPGFHKIYPRFSEVFPTTYVFPTQAHVTAHGYYWTAQLVLREAMWTLATTSAARVLVAHAQREAFRRGATECADALCRMVPAAWSPDPSVESYTAFTSCLVGPVALCCPMDFVVRWYGGQGEVAKRMLCEAVVVNMHWHLIRSGLSSPFGKMDIVEQMEWKC